ncbi:hypothetical protein [Limnohabitans sp.]|jgi:hypothetical protein|uniref:hypothetical protein n=1 Tax=Limnohabitans sp. TaxID=1907725 RepID=UPI00286F0B22|nr:hypothetical protein [Limnohabitans sp.]
MNFQNTWYVIERNQHFETISYEALALLPEGSFVMLQNFETHREALEEHKRLVKLAIDDTKRKLAG